VDWIQLAQDKSSGGGPKELSASIKDEEFLDNVRNYQLLKKVSSPWSWLKEIHVQVTKLLSYFFVPQNVSCLIILWEMVS
jgi:hypothetical protein